MKASRSVSLNISLYIKKGLLLTLEKESSRIKSIGVTKNLSILTEVTR